jgi:polysaccharide export outer membrane protein
MAATRKTIAPTLLAAMMALTGAVTVAQQTGPRIAASDHVAVSVYGVERLTGKFPIDVGGTLNFPLLGPLKAAGLTTRELEIELGRLLTEGGFFTVTPQITVTLEQTPNKRVTVTGAVRSAGQIMYAGELTVLDAIVRAGSTTIEAGDEAIVVRNPQGIGATGAGNESHGVITVNLRELQSGNVAEHNVVLQDGDLVVVQRAQSVFVSGQVRSPGAVRVETGTTVLQVLALAGGVNERGTTRGLRIQRDGKYVEDVTLDTVVLPGDTLIVRASPW